jgi:branched-chain amino acid transport system permease protein
VLIGPANSSFDITLGFSVMLGGFAAAILGGFGSLSGVVIGGFLIGLVEQLFGGYVLRDYRGAYPFVLMILVIALRPQGLLSGRAAHERL